jgi:uroporphyrin-III C-methyltransferase
MAAIARALIAGGLPGETEAAAIASATTPQQRVLISTLRDLAEDLARERFQAPAIVVIGRIVTTRERLLALLPPSAEVQA